MASITEMCPSPEISTRLKTLLERVFLRFGERHLGRIVFARDERPRAAEDVKSAAPKRRGGDSSIIITVHQLLSLRPVSAASCRAAGAGWLLTTGSGSAARPPENKPRFWPQRAREPAPRSSALCAAGFAADFASLIRRRFGERLGPLVGWLLDR